MFITMYPPPAALSAPSRLLANTGPSGHRLHLLPSDKGCSRGLCHVCGYLSGDPCNGSEQGEDGPCDAGLYPKKYGGNTCVNTGTSMPEVDGVYYHHVDGTNDPDMTRPLVPRWGAQTSARTYSDSAARIAEKDDTRRTDFEGLQVRCNAQNVVAFSVLVLVAPYLH